MPRLHLTGRITPGPLVLDAGQSRRLSEVVRLREGDEFRVFNGDGHEWRATVNGMAKAQLRVTIGEVSRQEAPPAVVLEVWCALVRPNRFEWAIEKCTEAGADIIRPLLCERTVRGDGASAVKQERWSRIAVEAAEQCGRLTVPVVEQPARFTGLLAGARVALVVADGAGKPWPQLLPLLPIAGRLVVAIGPEGGFTPAELEQARMAGGLFARLGPNTLRSETAAVAACALVRSLAP
ncbi:MAG: 16S rRNA (uracil(1498)-N(3))-methyltransferase [Chloroflexi bacterium]|nr:16S rRNA (uracil(1498)-N(3))-methyltransferase [Chloroflexota bacterium]